MSAGLALAKRDQKIYFFSDTAMPVDKQTPLVTRPSTLVMFEDGQWIIEELNWTGWGSSVARATGVSSSSNDKPNAVEGARITSPARVTLSKPGRFHGHRVYRCFRLKVPASPKSDQYRCLQHAGSAVLLLPPGSGDSPV